jgi:hypothetical protein
MRFLTNAELRELVDFTDVDHDFLVQGFKLAAIGSGRPNLIWTTMEKLEEDARKHAIDNGFDPETMLVVYDPPKTEEERKAAEEETRRQIEEDPDWDDIQIGYVDPNQVIASVYKDMTPERLVELLLKPWKLRVFS